MDEELRRKLGDAIGTMLVGLFKMMAALDGMTLKDAIETWVSMYVAEIIIEEAEEDDAL